MDALYQGKNRPKFAVAPMLDWTDRHCRFFHRQLSGKALLYTEMIVADAVIYGDRSRLLDFNAAEHPLALQLGGVEANSLREAALIAQDFGYDEINLNVGCPSHRVQSGAFGACLMLEPERVAQGVAAMKRAVSIPVSVKCRLGVDDQDPENALTTLGRQVIDAGVDALWIHARKAWLKGLSPKENREIPPLDHACVYRFKQQFPDIFVGINGGIGTLEAARAHLTHIDGVMVGRAAYHNPLLLTRVDEIFYQDRPTGFDLEHVIDIMCDYCEAHIARGRRLNEVTRHMVGLFHGVRGARQWRQILSTKANERGATAQIVREAFAAVDQSINVS